MDKTAVVRIAVIDDWMRVARQSADWSTLEKRADVTCFHEPFGGERETAIALANFDVIVPMRERTAFPATLLEQLPRLRLLALTGRQAPHVDLACCMRRRITCCWSGTYSPAATAELALGLIIAAVRGLVPAEESIRAGRFQEGAPIGEALEGKTLGIVGYGRIGERLARLGLALGMHVQATSTSQPAASLIAHGVAPKVLPALLATSDIVSLHLRLTPATRQRIAERELRGMKPGALLVNTARADLVDEAALLAALHDGRIRAALDVYREEPLPSGSAILRAPGTLLTPHLGFSTTGTMSDFYRQSVENILAFLQGNPKRLLSMDDA